MKKFLILMMLSMSMFFIGCEDGSQEVTTTCITGETQVCNCSSDSKSTQVCNSNNQWDICRCDEAHILNGVFDNADTLPFVVSVNQSCSGTLIDNRHVITAAHCVCHASAGKQDTSNCDPTAEIFLNNIIDSTSISVGASVNVHPDFSFTLEGKSIIDREWPDIALLTLDECAPIRPIKIRATSLQKNDNITVSGFGRIDCTEINNEKRHFGNNIVNSITSDFIELIAGSDSLTAYGDSGGALLKRDDNIWYLSGVTSSGSACIDGEPIKSSDVAQYTNITSWKSWVDNIIATENLSSCGECEANTYQCLENDKYKDCETDGPYNLWSESLTCDAPSLISPFDNTTFNSSDNITFTWELGKNVNHKLGIRDLTTDSKVNYDVSTITSKTFSANNFIVGHTYRWVIEHESPCSCSSTTRTFTIEDSICTGESTRTCGMCGTESRACNPDGTWSNWSGNCLNEGVCYEGDYQDCGTGGKEYCLSNCQWGTCGGECTDTCSSLGKECGTVTVCGQSQNCGSCYGGESCNSSNQCVENQICSPYDTESESCYINHGTGTRTNTCASDGMSWNEGSCTVLSCYNGYHQSGNSCVENDNDPIVNTVSPTTVTSGELTTFTVSGTNLPSTLSFWIANCEGLEKIYVTDTTAKWKCTPNGNTGYQDGIVKTQAGGTVLKNFSINVQSCTPIVNSVSPLTAYLNQTTTFTVSGSCLPSTLTFWVANCKDVAKTSSTSTSVKFTCEPSYGGIGYQDGDSRDQPGGTILKSFRVNVYN